MAHQLLLPEAPVRSFDTIPKCLLGRTLLGVTALVVTCASPSPVWAQATSEPEQVDTARGTLSGSTRRIGLGGAFVAIADDTEGVAINPASVALRLPYSWHAWDYGVGVDFAVGAWLPKNDIYNEPDGAAAGDSSALFGSLAAIIYYQHAGLGVAAEAQRNATSQPAQMQGVDTNLAANFGMVHASLGYGFADGQVLVGAGPRIVGVSFDRHSSGSGPLSQAGVGAEAGLMIKPQVAQYRVALAVKSPIDAVVPGEVGTVEQTLHIPWEAALGFAYNSACARSTPLS